MCKEYTCGFKYCSHENKKVPESEAIKSGGRYYHSDCLNIRNNMDAAKRIYYEKISKTVVMSHLVKTIQMIVINKGVDSEFLLFALKYAIAHNIPIKNPNGLHYIIDNASIKKAWKNKLGNIERNEACKKAKETNRNEGVKFEKPTCKPTSFNSIFGGD